MHGVLREWRTLKAAQQHFHLLNVQHFIMTIINALLLNKVSELCAVWLGLVCVGTLMSLLSLIFSDSQAWCSSRHVWLLQLLLDETVLLLACMRINNMEMLDYISVCELWILSRHFCCLVLRSDESHICYFTALTFHSLTLHINPFSPETDAPSITYHLD